jgi:hypothetical protein
MKYNKCKDTSVVNILIIEWNITNVTCAEQDIFAAA